MQEVLKMELLNELNTFACGLNAEQKAREAIEAKFWNMLFNGSKEK